MLTKDFDYFLPEELIAQQPTAQRVQSRLLIVPQNQAVRDLHIQSFSEALQLIALQRGKSGRMPLVILNESKVYPARVMISKKLGAQGEVFILNEAVLSASNDSRRTSSFAAQDPARESVRVLLRPLKKMRVGEVLYDSTGAQPLFEIECVESQNATVRLLKPLCEIFSRFAVMPTPPYIRREHSPNSPDHSRAEQARVDFERYQNVYASALGSAAAPTAGLHFSADFLADLASQNHVEFAKITLHVGIGTFRPVQTALPSDHGMHSEYYIISKKSLDQIKQAHQEKRPIVYLGTTSFRAVESFFLNLIETNKIQQNTKTEDLQRNLFENANDLCDKLLETSLFVYPKTKESGLYQPVIGDAIFTNFHQPQSTLLMLICALAGYQLTMSAYKHAIQKQYRFLSYGDASIFEFAQNSLLDRSRNQSIAGIL